MARSSAKGRREPPPEDDVDDSPAGKADEIEASDDAEPAPKPKRKRKRSKKKSAQGKRGKGKDSKDGSRSAIGRLFYWSAVLGLWLVIACAGVLVYVGMHLPPLQSLEIPKRPPTIHIVAADGRPLATRGDMGGAAVPLRELPAHVPKAFLAIEDRRFYSHYGIDPIGLTRALVANAMRRGVAQGGSTITQQLAKNLFLTQERTYGR